MSNVTNSELVNSTNNVEMYSPVVEDISMEDQFLCNAVDQIENLFCLD